MFASGIISIEYSGVSTTDVPRLTDVIDSTLKTSSKIHNIQYNAHVGGIDVEGEWDDIMNVLAKCRDAVRLAGAQRVGVRFNLHTRTDKRVTLRDEMNEVEAEYTRLIWIGE
ncbi:hypothetical protein BCR33DRAFT_725131 [Rhizoclosmatium globosum]|uniref:Thiamine-binding protein domain-containing protein n=1 Tax=Rhizoclosmatium globosum TaxID=329046 RepID=A0A1Y2B0Q2_9FUNG|nr:hypothetical protein BCR33DRAFT_725131 [Rhizoclosmatium globosum]|eukprot:ORY28428.1 hypothetical protein BCR33DRAFT_725131 [Rhizoclosmatium globosum]